MDENNGIELVDLHCHLDLHEDMAGAYRRCDVLNCATLAVTTTPKAFERNRQFAERTRYAKAALGLHPQLVAERAAELKLFESLLPSTRYVGEIGLDAGKAHYSSFSKQIFVFQRILDLCKLQGGKVISVHSARCPKKVLDCIEQSGAYRTCKIVLHWFSASKSEIQRAIDIGCFFSVNERLLETTNGRNVLALAPGSRMLTETDAPFLEINGRLLQGGDVENSIALIAKSWAIPLDVARSKIARNAIRVLG